MYESIIIVTALHKILFFSFCESFGKKEKRLEQDERETQKHESDLFLSCLFPPFLSFSLHHWLILSTIFYFLFKFPLSLSFPLLISFTLFLLFLLHLSLPFSCPELAEQRHAVSFWCWFSDCWYKRTKVMERMPVDRKDDVSSDTFAKSIFPLYLTFLPLPFSHLSPPSFLSVSLTFISLHPHDSFPSFHFDSFYLLSFSPLTDISLSYTFSLLSSFHQKVPVPFHGREQKCSITTSKLLAFCDVTALYPG